MKLHRIICWLACVTALTTASGCTPEAHQYIRFPRLFDPGPAGLQRAEAIRHDPYPLNDVGPEIEGGRPREYQQPVNEVERARMLPPRPGVVQAVPALPWAAPAPAAPAAPPAVMTAPYPAVPAPAPRTTPFPVQPRPPY